MAARQGLSSTTEEIRDALRHVLRAGFPITDDTAGDLLPDQRVVIAHAQHPDERGSRVTALERVIRQILKEFGQSTRGQAARALFAVDKTLRRTTLTHRREVAARILDRDPDHTRKHIEPRILDEVAFAFHQENLRYQPVTDSSRPKIAPHEDTPVLTDDSFTEEEELLCRVWSAVYGFRAELIATQRRMTDTDGSPDPELDYHLDSAKWQLAKLLTAVTAYLDNYGEEIMHGDTPFNVEGLVTLAGWHGGIGGDEAKHLRYALARAGPDERQDFLDALNGET
jgi:hypothetical protein